MDTHAADRGWICPRCDAVNAPGVLKCACSPKAATSAENGLLEQLRQLAKDMQGQRPVFVPYPVYPVYPTYPYPRPYYPDVTWIGNGITYTSNGVNISQQSQLGQCTANNTLAADFADWVQKQ